MPYIKQERRLILNPDIAELRAKLATLGDVEGDLNYVISRLVGGYFFKNQSYSRIAQLTGVLENVKQEFHRMRCIAVGRLCPALRSGCPEYLTVCTSRSF